MKLLNTANIDVNNNYWWYFDFELPTGVLAKKSAKFERRFADHRYFGICAI